MSVAPGELGQAQAVGLDQPHSSLIRALQKLAHARIAPGRFEQDFDDGFRGRFETNAHGVKTEQDFG